jgi:hypothetical protein
MRAVNTRKLKRNEALVPRQTAAGREELSNHLPRTRSRRPVSLKIQEACFARLPLASGRSQRFLDALEHFEPPILQPYFFATLGPC